MQEHGVVGPESLCDAFLGLLLCLAERSFKESGYGVVAFQTSHLHVVGFEYAFLFQ